MTGYTILPKITVRSGSVAERKYVPQVDHGNRKGVVTMRLGGQVGVQTTQAERKSKLQQLSQAIERLRLELYKVEAERNLERLKQVESSLDELIAEHMRLQRG